MESEIMESFIGAFFGAAFVVVFFGTFFTSTYLIPTLIAAQRRTEDLASIFIMNFLIGWTVVGWIGALIWAVTNNPKKRNLERA